MLALFSDWLQARLTVARVEETDSQSPHSLHIQVQFTSKIMCEMSLVTVQRPIPGLGIDIVALPVCVRLRTLTESTCHLPQRS